MKHAVLFALFCIVGAPHAQAQSDARRPLDHNTEDTDRFGRLVPDFAKLQTGGYSGLITAGLGYSAFHDIINIGADYGYVPASHAGRTVHALTTSLGVRPFHGRLGRFRLVPGYLWAGLLFADGEGYFFGTDGHYPSGYYPPTAVNTMYGIGVELDWRPADESFVERHGLYWEARVFGPYLMTFLENREQLALRDVVVSALGYRVAW